MWFKIALFLPPARSDRLDASGAAEPDRDLIAVHDHRYGAAPLAEPEHALELGRVFLDVDVLERHVPPIKILTGGLGVGSGVLAEDVDHTVIVPDLKQGLTEVRMGV